MSDNDFIFEMATSMMRAQSSMYREGYKSGFREGFRQAIKKYTGSWVVGEDGKTLTQALEEAEKECLTTQ